MSKQTQKRGGRKDLRGDDSVSRPTTCSNCIISLSAVCDLILGATCETSKHTKKQAIAVITSKPKYRDVELQCDNYMGGNESIMPDPAAVCMSGGLDLFWEILPRLPLHEFMTHWISFLFLRHIPVYVCIHDPVTGVVCAPLLARVVAIQTSVADIVQNATGDCTPRDTMAYDLINAVLGIKDIC
jgi:hypothetical protein